MDYTRRSFTKLSVASLFGLGLAPGLAGSALAQSGSDTIDTESGALVVHPIQHASLALTGVGPVIYADPVGDPSMYGVLPDPDIILITHEHADHYSPETLSALVTGDTKLITNPNVFEMLPAGLKAKAQKMANGDSLDIDSGHIEAIPAYNTTEERKQYHPEGRDNGYILTLGGKKVYIAGDTEDTPEMRALSGIALAFLPMNLPYTMTIDQAADAVTAFGPQVVYPYHYRGSDVEQFKALVDRDGSDAEVRLAKWY